METKERKTARVQARSSTLNILSRQSKVSIMAQMMAIQLS
jgi:hypothetical protein